MFDSLLGGVLMPLPIDVALQVVKESEVLLYCVWGHYGGYILGKAAFNARKKYFVFNRKLYQVPDIEPDPRIERSWFVKCYDCFKIEK
jgi:hypothetical protein